MVSAFCSAAGTDLVSCRWQDKSKSFCSDAGSRLNSCRGGGRAYNGSGSAYNGNSSSSDFEQACPGGVCQFPSAGGAKAGGAKRANAAAEAAAVVNDANKKEKTDDAKPMDVVENENVAENEGKSISPWNNIIQQKFPVSKTLSKTTKDLRWLGEVHNVKKCACDDPLNPC